jgi:methylamine--corrinoid protein Co-methyltransferase
VVLGLLLYLIARFLIARALLYVATRTENRYDDIIVEELRPFRLAWLAPLLVIWLGYVAGGPNTKSYFYESAAYLLSAVTSGAPSVQTPHPAKAVKTDGITPLEAKFGVEMAIAAAKLKREQANALVIQLLEKYESQIETAPTGSRYQECYDVRTGKPGADYLRLFDEVKGELAGMGVPFE